MRKTEENSQARKRLPPATTPEARENQMISLAIDMAEEQLRNRTAPAQVITHYLRLAATKERLEKEKLEKEITLLQARADAIESEKRREELYANAIEAMRGYRWELPDERQD